MLIYNCSQYFHPTWSSFHIEATDTHLFGARGHRLGRPRHNVGRAAVWKWWRPWENMGKMWKLTMGWNGVSAYFRQTHVKVLKPKHGSNLIPSDFNWFHQLHSCLGNPRTKWASKNEVFCMFFFQPCLITPQGNYPTIWYPMVSPVIPGEFPGPVACSG